MNAKRPRVTAAADLTDGFLRALKKRGQEVGVWEVRGRVFARVMVAGRDARLSGSEWSVLVTIALHLQHLGRSKGMLTIAKLSDDGMYTERQIRNALRTLEAQNFLTVKHRHSGQMTVMLDRRFGPRAPVPSNKAAGKSPRRCVPRKNISTTRDSSLRSSPLVTDECTDSAPRRESTASASPTRTANGELPWTIHDITPRVEALGESIKTLHRLHTMLYGPAPPRKRALPVASG